jgi:hypothetical protein
MSERTDYGAVAEKIDYAKLERKLDQLRDREPPKNGSAPATCWSRCGKNC